MEKKDIVLFSKEIEKQLHERYQDPTLCNQYAWWMIEAITNKEKTKLIAQKEINLTTKQIITLQNWIKKQTEEHTPLQYLLGSVPFDNIEILVEPPILIPRPETEEICYTIINMLQKLNNKNITILDIGTGSGCIALTLAKALPESTVYAVDISDKAIALASKNAKHNNIKNVTFLKSDVYQGLQGITFDIIISNPPYIAENEWKTLDASVTQWEDKKALVANNQGIAIIERIVLQASEFLKKNPELLEKKIPQLIIEIGYQQGPSVAKLFKNAGFIDIHIQKDLEGKDRFVWGHLDIK